MPNSTNSLDNRSIEEKLAALHTAFQLRLPEKISAINHAWAQILNKNNVPEELTNLHHLTHSLAGSAGTFGAIAVGTAAREVEILLKTIIPDKILLTDELISDIEQLIAKIEQTAKQSATIMAPYLDSSKTQNHNNKFNSLIYLVEDDELLGQELTAKLEILGYTIKHFHKISEFVSYQGTDVPAAILMDMVFDEGDTAGADAIHLIKQKISPSPSVIFISVRTDIEARLAAARAGAVRYFSKPLEIDKLIQTLDGLTTRVAIEPYRILLIDDEQELLKYYAAVLENAGMEVLSLSNPLLGLETLHEFKPDLVLLDVYMSGCTGTELAQVIRQDDDYAQMPIMFLSTESHLDRQLAALHLGGDDFLTKPVKAEHLISAVTARVKRARWTNRLTQDLKKTLRESEYSRIALDQHAILSITDTKGNITFANNKFCEISGYRRDELVGQNQNIVKSGIQTKDIYDKLWQTISQGKIWHGQLCNRSKDGNYFWINNTIVPFLDEHGHPYQYVAVSTDITALTKIKDRLALSQKFSHIGNWDWNIKSGEVYWSKAVYKMLGLNQQSKNPNLGTLINIVHPEDRPLLKRATDDCLLENTVYNVEVRVVMPDNTIRWIHSSGDVLRAENGTPLHMFGIMQDITQRKVSEQALRISTNEAENANRAKSQFLSNMSHELRTPLNAIIGFAQLLKMNSSQELSTEQLDYTNEIFKAGNHLLTLINEVLDLSTIEAGKILLSIESIRLAEVISECVGLTRPLAEKRGIQIESLYINDRSIPVKLGDIDIRVKADQTRLKQALLNLLSNAVKYNIQNGKVTLTCKTINDNQSVRICIADTGTGISKEHQQQLFKSFNRLGAEHSGIEGTGIGLVISRNIIELMAGSIGFESEEHEGSTFWIDLPVGVNLDNNQDHADDHTLNFSPPISTSKKSILYIEDNLTNLKLVSQVLAQRQNFHLWSAPEPLVGIELALEHTPDLILLDLNLPGMDGFSVFDNLQSLESTSHIPVIAISANAEESDINNTVSKGFKAYITKPINVTNLLKTIDSILPNGELT